eukprot:TRINITY_DN38869_c0_g1_i2.p1 TRINITY_DN38869_c0_g1~~TRINITY_DN38869_c0_g1_i2.p1  ORF type:complete len:275 (-),score=25.48 TRINITY_DN38869_c0_g1_i2:181-1005(-)
MKDFAGIALLSAGLSISLLSTLMAYQLYGRYSTLDHALLMVFGLGHTYSALTFLVGGLLPLRIVYQRPDILEMMHRSRYLIFDCIALPCVLWFLLLVVHRGREELGLSPASMGLFDEPWRWVTITVLSCTHLGVAGLAAPQISRYPMNTANCMGVLYWRPTRFTHRMRYPVLSATRGLWVLAILWLVFAQQKPLLLVAAAVLHVAFHGHMSEYRFWGWEIFVQPLAAAVVSFAVMQAMHISLQCNWRTFDPSQCVIVSPKGPVHLLGGLSQLRF